MPKTQSPRQIDVIRDAIDRSSHAFAEFMPDFFDAVQSFLTALDYQDTALMRSHLETASSALVQTMETHVPKFVAWSADRRAEYERVIAELEGRTFDWPDASLDALGRTLEVELGQLQRTMTNVRIGWVKTFAALPPPPGTDAIEAELAAVVELRRRVVDGWPWSHREPPPVNWAMVEASRTARAGGETGEDVNDLIRQLGGE